MGIDIITGHAYAVHAKERLDTLKALQCPYPHLEKLFFKVDAAQGGHSLGDSQCDYVFSRAYDLRRHMRASHDIDADKDSVDEWVKIKKRQSRL